MLLNFQNWLTLTLKYACYQLKAEKGKENTCCDLLSNSFYQIFDNNSKCCNTMTVRVFKENRKKKMIEMAVPAVGRAAFLLFYFCYIALK